MRERVIVIGAGVAGAAAAARLAAHADVLVLEQGAQAGAEATAQNAGMLRRLVVGALERDLACRTADALPRLDLPPGAWRPVGGVVALHEDTARFDAAVQDLQARGVLVDDGGPELAPALAGAPIRRALRVPSDGLLDAHALTAALLTRATAAGAEIRLRAPLDRLHATNERITGVRLRDGAVLPADRVVIAAGAWASRLAPPRPLQPMARHLLVTDSHPAFSPDHPWTWVDDAGIYARPEAGGWLISPCDERPVAIGEGPGSAGPIDPEQRAVAHDKLERWLPALRDVRFKGGWTGLRTFTPDRHPLLGDDPVRPGLTWFCGFGGFGVSCAVGAAERLSVG